MESTEYRARVVTEMVVHVTVRVEDGDEERTREEADALFRALDDGFLPEVRAVERPAGGPAPDGARGGELAVLGGLLVTMVGDPESVRAVLRYIAGRITGRRGSVELEIDDRRLRVEKATTEQVDTLIDAYLRKVFDQDS
jgi:hypothetical protein